VLPLVNCKVGKVKKAKSKSVPKGDVISTNPGGGKKLAAGTKVAIKASSGKPKKKAKK
jgi:beta-lactam-binding protein with PASTA domain